jgi:hypothetical protein
VICIDQDFVKAKLWPREETPLPLDDYDMTKDRMLDIMNYDKTEYYLKVAMFVTDYIEVVRDLVNQLAKDGVSADGQGEVVKKEAADRIRLNDSKTKSKFRDGRPRTYLDLLIGRFDVNEKLRIERTEDNKDIVTNNLTSTLNIQDCNLRNDTVDCYNRFVGTEVFIFDY